MDNFLIHRQSHFSIVNMKLTAVFILFGSALCFSFNQIVPKIYRFKLRNANNLSMEYSSSTPVTSNQRLLKNKKSALAQLTLSTMAFGLLYSNPSVSKADGFLFFNSAEQDLINKIASSQKQVNDVLYQLKPNDTPNSVGVYIKQQILKGGKEDSDVVANYLQLFIKPLQENMLKLQSSGAIKFADSQVQDRFNVLPLLMKGHILELEQAIVSQKADEQAKEVEEVQETLLEFLKLVKSIPSSNDPSQSKYDVTIYVPSQPLSDKDLFGPLGCEFYGKKRIPGSNACTPSQ